MEILELGALKMLDAIKAWQSGQNGVHELTCGKCKGHVKLEGKMIATNNLVVVSTQEGSKITLKCPKCDYVQDFVPECVYQWYIETHLSHKIHLGQVVEVEITDDYGADAIFHGQDYDFQGRYGNPSEGVTGAEEIVLRFVGNLRALVVGYSKDCDGTPLYCLSNIRVKYNSSYLPDKIRGSLTETLNYKKWAEYLKTGIAEEELKIIEGQFVPLLYNSIFEYEDSMMSDL